MKNRQETEQEINIRAWKDPAFKKKLSVDPHAALKDLGLKNLPNSVKIRFIEESKNEWCIILHASPPNAQNLSDKELKNMSAAGCSTPSCMP